MQEPLNIPNWVLRSNNQEPVTLDSKKKNKQKTMKKWVNKKIFFKGYTRAQS